LLDAWAEKHLHQPRDDQGNWARKGKLQLALLNEMLEDSFFKLAPPKSTGREYFNLTWLKQFSIEQYEPIDVQTTLTELTAQSMMNMIKSNYSTGEILLCGGGVHNTFLRERLQTLCTGFTLETTEKYGIHPDWVEATAFAWLAKQTLARQPGNLTAVTGARQSSILGGVYYT
jgi:anhydro-N-acetylmuramic acid kinase